MGYRYNPKQEREALRRKREAHVSVWKFAETERVLPKHSQKGKNSHVQKTCHYPKQPNLPKPAETEPKESPKQRNKPKKAETAHAIISPPLPLDVPFEVMSF
jgi:hypothetical protein